MRRAKRTAAAIISGAAVITFLAPATYLRADWRWGSCLCGCGDRRSPQEWAAEAAALGVKGGAPALGFCGSVTGYERGIVRVPYPTVGSADATAGGVSAASPVPSSTLPPPSAPLPNPTPPRPAPPISGLR
jgi:hypothetical protein